MGNPVNMVIRRKAVGLTQGQLAARIGVRTNAVYGWEHGLYKPLRRNLAPMAEALQLPVEVVELAYGFLPESIQNQPTTMELLGRLAVLSRAEYWGIRGSVKDCLSMLPNPIPSPRIESATEPISKAPNGVAAEPEP